MSKNTKSKRPQRSNVASANPRSYSELLKQEKQRGITPVAPTPATPVVAEPAPRSSSKFVDWSAEYGHVFSDLRNLLVVSGVLIGLMIVLGFVI